MTRSTMSETKRARLVAASPVEIGDRVADKYRVERLVAAGGMGVVVQARHEVLGQKLAIKFLIPEAMAEQTAARFLREARAAARIQSERVVRVFDCGSLPSGVPYMVMEYLEGVEVAQIMRERGALAVVDAVDLVASALEGVAEAHALGIVHRDLKPSNLFLVNGWQRPFSVKVLDFGISKIQPGADTPVDDELTATSMLLGSPRYISPEQARSSSEVDLRADIWSVGVVLYELLDGACPFAGDTIGEVLSKILLHTPDPLQDKRADVPAELALVIARCLKRDRDQRFANVAELAQALAPFGSEHARIHAERIGVILDVPVLPEPRSSRPADRPATAPAAAERGDAVPGGDVDDGAPSAEDAVLGSDDPADAGATMPAPGQRTEERAWARTGAGRRPSRTRLALLVGLPALAIGALAGWYVLGPAPPAETSVAPTDDGPAASSAGSTAGAPRPEAGSAEQPEAGAEPPAEATAEASGASGGASQSPTNAAPRPTVATPRPLPLPPRTVTRTPTPPSSDAILGQSD